MKKLLTVAAFLSWGFICHRMGYYSAWEEHQDWDNPVVTMQGSGTGVNLPPKKR